MYLLDVMCVGAIGVAVVVVVVVRFCCVSHGFVVCRLVELCVAWLTRALVATLRLVRQAHAKLMQFSQGMEY